MDERLEAILSENLDLFGAGKINCAEAVLMTLCRYYGEDGKNWWRTSAVISRKTFDAALFKTAKNRAACRAKRNGLFERM